ncbi:MAG: RagB/SusD protein, partial [Gemmatimonadetes bacterium]|nr:RagB/SusD protein [Gemmatimonadota bacterium]
RTKTAVLAYISALLDSANNSLTASGVSATLPVALPSGFKSNGDYSTTANLSRFNRGLKGMVEVYRGLDHQAPCAACFTTAITALNSALAGVSATPTAAELAAGPYYQYNPSAPETFASPLDDNHIYLTDNFVQSIQSGDARASKIVLASAASSNVSGLQLTYRDPITDPAILANQTHLIPLARNALFFLTRAQAEAESGNLLAATADVNAVHVGEGGLPAYTLFTSLAAARQAILYEYRYSFIYEGPYHLVALREYSAVTLAYVTQPGMPTVTSDSTHKADPLLTTLPIPSTEAAARGGNVTPVP